MNNMNLPQAAHRATKSPLDIFKNFDRWYAARTMQFDTLLAESTSKGDPTVHGAIFKCVNKNGKEIYSKVAGHTSLSSTSAPLTDTAVLKAASSTKFFTSIALLQCIDRNLIGLDDPISAICPELTSPQITTLHPTDPNTPGSESNLTYTPSTTPITPRHLLTHTSGFSYWFLRPQLIHWATKTPEGIAARSSLKVPTRHNMPLLFNPGEGWEYGISLDWAGELVKRLTGYTSLETYMIDHIWRPLGLSAPFPTFCLSQASQEYKDRLMAAAERVKPEEGQEGQRPKLKEFEFWQGDNKEDQDGGHGLVLTTQDFVAVLADLVADEPKLLKPETMEMMFTPQLIPSSKATEDLIKLRVAWDMVAGPVAKPEECINHGLGGLLITKDTKEETGQPGGILCWGGAANTVWWACREKGVAGFMSTQLSPFGDDEVKKLVNAWRREFWESWDSGKA